MDNNVLTEWTGTTGEKWVMNPRDWTECATTWSNYSLQKGIATDFIHEYWGSERLL